MHTDAQSRNARRRSRTPLVITTLIGLAALTIGLVQILRPTLPLRVEARRLGDLPLVIWSQAGASGPAIVIAHGFAGSQQLMQPFAVTLARSGYTAITFDFPGHGQNETPLDTSPISRERRTDQLGDALDRVVALARTLGDGRVGLLGHSMGAGAVTSYASAHADIDATVAVSLFADQVAPDRPRNLLLLTGALESNLRPAGQAIIDAAAGGSGQTGTTYGDPAAGTARRLVFASGVEHIGVLYSPTSMRESLAWFDLVFGRSAAVSPIDRRTPWLGLTYLGAIALFWPLARLLQPIAQPRSAPTAPRWRWLIAALVPAIATPLLLRALPTQNLLPILVGGPLAVYFTLYGLLTAAGAALMRRPLGTTPESPRRSPAAIWLRSLAAALLIIGYVFLTFGLPAQWFVLNFFAPPSRWAVFAAVLVAMLPYFLADEWLTRSVGGPRWGYAATKIGFLAGLVLAILLDAQLFFLTLIAPLFVLYFAVFGWFSTLAYRRTGTILPGALANAVIFAWSVAAVFPLVG